MPKQKIMKIGNSICVSVPAFFVRAAGVRAGDKVEVKIKPEKGTVIYKFSGCQQLTLTEKLLKKTPRKRRKKR